MTENKTICLITDYGVAPDSPEDMTAAIQRVLDASEEGSCVMFSHGTYRISRPLCVRKNKLHILGDDVLLLHIGFDPWSREEQEQVGFFDIDGSAGITIEGFRLDFERDTAISGTIESINLEDSSFVMRLFEEYDWITGRENYFSINTFNSSGEPNYHIASCSGIVETTKIGPCLLKVRYEYTYQLEKATVGENVNIRLVVDGASSAVRMKNSEDICFRDVTVYQAVKNVFLIEPRCSDLLFDRVRVEIKPGRRQFMSSNADGIHIDGMAGKLEIRDCYFQALGDDALNIHSRAGIVTALAKDIDTLEFVDGWSKEVTVADWCRAGDVIYVYDPATFLKKAEMTVKSLDGNRLSVEQIPYNVGEGDVLCNAAFFAAVEVRRTTVCYGRARAFLLQTENIVIEDCNLYNMSLPAILMSPDIAHWYEVGPCKNAVIRNNRIHHCGHIVGGGMGCITVQACHDSKSSQYPAGVHQQLVIENNVITDAGCAGIYISSTDGVVIQNNDIFPQYINCFSQQPVEEKPPVVLENCTNVVCDVG